MRSYLWARKALETRKKIQIEIAYTEGKSMAYIDVVISYSGNIREDDFFNLLHEEGFSFAGIPVDINPISTEKTVSLEDYLKTVERYLDEKEAKQKSQPEKSVKRRESVVQALRDRQSKLKEQETEKPKQKTQTHKKGDHEL